MSEPIPTPLLGDISPLIGSSILGEILPVFSNRLCSLGFSRDINQTENKPVRWIRRVNDGRLSNVCMGRQPSPFAKQLAALALQSVLQTYAMTYVSPVIVFSPPPPRSQPPQIRIYDSHLQQKTIMRDSIRTSPAARRCANARCTSVCGSASHLCTFANGENLCTEPLRNAASSLMRPAGIGGPLTASLLCEGGSK